MHKFKRGDTPVEFRIIKQKYANWDAFIGSSEHIAIGDQLYEQQDHYCAYCELYLHDKQDGFIEHLEKRSDNPKRTFDWTNLFFACRHLDSCGIYKDNMVYDIHDIINPSVDDPLDFFTYDSEGFIHPKKGLSKSMKHKAEETIRVFNLNCPRLKQIRKDAASIVSYFRNDNLNPSQDAVSAFYELLGDKADCISVYHALLTK